MVQPPGTALCSSHAVVWPSQSAPNACYMSAFRLSSRPDPRGAEHRPGSDRSQAFEIQAVAMPATDSQQQAIHNTLRLLAAWAAKAARAWALASDPDHSPQPAGAERQHEPTQETDQ